MRRRIGFAAREIAEIIVDCFDEAVWLCVLGFARGGCLARSVEWRGEFVDSGLGQAYHYRYAAWFELVERRVAQQMARRLIGLWWSGQSAFVGSRGDLDAFAIVSMGKPMHC